ncbi:MULTISPECIES: hypothetical protein [Serratia]|uniref:hypothetical protein n=1 Tax=Serratia TaxID=613 RepID=UPI00178C7D6A|nr:hypothetical protein [Serratia marcescens]
MKRRNTKRRCGNTAPSDLQKAAQAVTGALTALAGNNLAGALASGASPYLATEIKKRVGEDNIAANAMAHAVLGAVTAQLNNQSAAAGGLGAGGGELAARYIAGQLFPGKTAQQLSESEKQQVGRKIQIYSYLGYVLDERMEINVIVIKIKHPFSEIPV